MRRLGCNPSSPSGATSVDSPQWPKTATLRLTMPRTPWAQEEVRCSVKQELKHLETKAHEQVRTKGWRVLGRSTVLRSSPYEQATSWEPLRSLNPNIAVGRGQRQVFFYAMKILQTFRHAYRLALEKWREGCRTVVFPFATWQMHWLHGVQVAPG